MTALSDWLSALGQDERLALSTVIAVGLGLAIGQTYAHHYRGIVLSRSFVHTCVVTVILVSFAINTVIMAGNVGQALGFALVGLLSLIRFRTVVRDTREFSFMLLCIVVGVLLGAFKIGEAVIGCVLVLGLLVMMERFDIGSTQSSSFRVKIIGPIGSVSIYEEKLEALCSKVQTVSIRQKKGGRSTYDFEVAIILTSDIQNIIASLESIADTEEVTMARLQREKAPNLSED